MQGAPPLLVAIGLLLGCTIRYCAGAGVVVYEVPLGSTNGRPLSHEEYRPYESRIQGRNSRSTLRFLNKTLFQAKGLKIPTFKLRRPL